MIILCIFYIILCIFYAFFLRNINVISKRLLLCFQIVWTIAFTLLVWNPINFYPINTYTYILVLVNVLSFSLGYYIIICKSKACKYFHITKLIANIERLSSNKYFKILSILILIYTTYIFATNIRTLLLYQSLSNVRDLYFEDADKLYGANFSLIRDFVLTPFSSIVTPIFAYLCYKRINIWTIIYGVFLFENASLSGGRFGYVKIFIGFLFVLFCILINEPQKKIIRFVSIITSVFFFIIISTTMLRSGNLTISTKSIADSKNETLEQFAIYVSGPIAALNYSIENDYVRKLGGHTFGAATFCSVDRLIQPIVKIFNPTRLPVSNDFIGFKQENLISIYPSHGTYNALYTAILFFWMDYGFLGVLILPFIIGSIFARSVINLFKTSNVASFVIVYWLFAKCLHSIFDYALISSLDLLFWCALLYWSKIRK